MMTLEANGVTYDGFKSATASTSMEEISGSFSFAATIQKSIFIPIHIGDTCKIYIDKTPIINGYVEKIDSSYDEKSHDVIIGGRDKTCDIIDSTTGGKLSFSGGIGLVDLTKKILSKMNITGINVSSNVDLEPFSKNEMENSQLCESVFDFILKYAKKRQVLINTDGNGNIVFTRSSTNAINSILTSSDIAKSTILNASLKLDNTNRFYKYILNSQTNPSSTGGESAGQAESWEQINVSAEKSCNITAVAYDPDIRTSRIHNFQEEAVHKEKVTSEITSWEQMGSIQGNRKDGDLRAQWEANIRRAKALEYTCTVQGFKPIDDQGLIWRPNLLVTVVDDILDFNAQLLIKSVTYEYGLDVGSKTTLTLVDQKTFTLELIEGIKKHKKGTGQVEGYKFATSS